MEESLSEILDFLTLSSRLDLKVTALETVLGLTGSPEGLQIISNNPQLITNLFLLLEDTSKFVAKDTSLALINISADKATLPKWINKTSKNVFAKLWNRIEYINEDSPKDGPMTKPDPSVVVDPCCMILSNLTIDPDCCDIIWTEMTMAGASVAKIVQLLCLRSPEGPNRHYLSTAVSNLSQLRRVREKLLDPSDPLLAKLFVFTEHPDIKRRGGTIGTIRNCCFDTSQHEWLLGKMDILPRLLLPLAGPTPETLDDEDIEKLPIDLQYLDDSKTVEVDPDIRKLLLEALLQLLATKMGREYLRCKNTYFILRELHKNEQEKLVLLACENVIDILIKKEEEININNYHEHEVPDDVVPKLEEMDQDYLKD